MADDLNEALRRHQNGELDRAIPLYQAFLRIRPDHPDALHLLGLALYQQGNSSQAIPFISRAIGLAPLNAGFHSNLGEIYRCMGQLDRAAACLQTALRLDPANAEAMCNLSLTLSAQGNREAAIAMLQKALVFKPQFALAHNNLANVYREQGDKQRALEHFRRAVGIAPNLPEARSNLGQLLLELDCAAEALLHCQEAVRLRPRMPEARNNLGNVLRELGRLEEAKQSYGEAQRLGPHIGMTYNNMAQAFQEEGNLSEAKKWYEQALLRDPTAARIHCNLASVWEDEENIAEARARYQLALQLDPSYPDAHVGLAALNHDEARLDDAVTGLREAIRLRPDFATAHSKLGAIQEEQGQLEDAKASFREALRHSPRHAAAYSQLAILLKKEMPDEDVIAMENLLAESNESAGNQMALHYGLAQVYDARKDFNRAAEHLRRANELRLAAWIKEGKSYHADEHERFVDRLIGLFTPEFFATRKEYGSDSRRPIFIVGLPRSGTTLTEQILASHSQVFGAGELKLARQAFESTPRLLGSKEAPIDALPKLGRSDVDRLTQDYLKELSLHNGDAPHVVDKMPDNYLYLGFLMMLFPKAKFIHTRRDVRDVAVSCWMTNFKSIRWACHPDHIARRVQTYRRIMDHWRKVLPLPILEVDYEDTVTQLESVARRLVEWCELDWEPKCLEFHQTERVVRTASVTQVRQPIYTRSVERWRNYEPALADLFRRIE